MAYLRLLTEQGIALLGALVLVASGAQAATLNVVDGQLMGASGVIVDGTAYNVQFLDGACIELFNGCDDASDFIWQTRDAAILASQALLDQVFLDVPQGLFDNSPNLTNGCNSLHNCEVLSKFPVFITDHGVSVRLDHPRTLHRSPVRHGDPGFSPQPPQSLKFLQAPCRVMIPGLDDPFS